MKSRFAASVPLFLLLASVCTASGPCVIGLYGDAEGTVNGALSGATWVGYGGLDLYVVLQVEDVVSAVAYDLVVTSNHVQPPPHIFQADFYGPAGTGINVQSPGGNNVGLGECAVGIGGQKILVAKYTVYTAEEFNLDYLIRIVANVDAHNSHPAYSTCQHEILPCESQSFFFLESVRTESVSWSKIKALF